MESSHFHNYLNFKSYHLLCRLLYYPLLLECLFFLCGSGWKGMLFCTERNGCHCYGDGSWSNLCTTSMVSVEKYKNGLNLNERMFLGWLNYRIYSRTSRVIYSYFRLAKNTFDLYAHHQITGKFSDRIFGVSYQSQPSPSNFGCDSELIFHFIMIKLTLILTLNDSHYA